MYHGHSFVDTASSLLSLCLPKLALLCTYSNIFIKLFFIVIFFKELCEQLISGRVRCSLPFVISSNKIIQKVRQNKFPGDAVSSSIFNDCPGSQTLRQK